MTLESVTLQLLGDEIPLSEYAAAVSGWRALMDALSHEVAGSDVSWVIESLSAGSASATVKGQASDPTLVDSVVRGYQIVGEHLATNKRPPYSDQVVSTARALTKVLNGHVDGLKFETAERDFVVRARASTQPELAVPLQAYGAIEGRVETLSRRGGLRFTLYDLITNRAVSCYLAEGREDTMRNAWGRRAIVEGWISRDPVTGRALTVRRVSAVTIVAEDMAGSYRDARGVVPLAPGELSPERAIRRLRDG